MTEPWVIAIVTNAVVLMATLWVMSIRTTWKVSQIKADIIGAITAHAVDDRTEFAKVRHEIGIAGGAFGETIMALKQKVNDVELEASKNYVRREGFWKSMEQLTNSLTSLRAELRADLLRMEQKIDSKT